MFLPMTSTDTPEKVYGNWPTVPFPGIKSRVARYYNARAMFRDADRIEAARASLRAEDDVRRLPHKAFAKNTRRQIARARLYDFRERQAWCAILEGVSDPFVKWVVETYPPDHDYHHEAVMVLSEMPCTREQLFALALESQWCSEFEAAIEAAEEAGVL